MKEEKYKGSHICKACHSIIIPKKRVKGSFAIELLLWIVSLALVPLTLGISLLIGLSYSFWRIFNKDLVCPVCGSTEVVPIDTPVAREIIEKMGLEEVK